MSKFNRMVGLRILPVTLMAALMNLGFQPMRAEAQCKGEWVQRSPATSPSTRALQAMAFDSLRGVTVLFGGQSDCDPFGHDNGETWTWDGTNWSKKSPLAAPIAQGYGAMVFDSARGVCVFFGRDENGDGKGETWEWDGTSWSHKSPAAAPTARIEFGLAYDAGRGVCVLFGGENAGVKNGETWEYDGTNWSQKTPANAPSARRFHAMAYDATRGETILFGGEEMGGSKKDDTWLWDGTNWTLITPAAHPSARVGAQIAYDSARQVVVLFGGYTATVLSQETWEWDGSNWLLRTPTNAPRQRYLGGLAFDSVRRVSVFFAGEHENSFCTDDTWEWAGPGPFVQDQSKNQTIEVGTAAALSVTAGGISPFTYRWRKNGSNLTDGGSISGATTKTLTIQPAAQGDSAEYSCRVGNTCGAAISSSISLSVVPSCATTDATGDCDGNQILDACEITADPALDANADGTLDACESPESCGLCGGGAATMMPLLISCLSIGMRSRRGIRSRQKHE